MICASVKNGMMLVVKANQGVNFAREGLMLEPPSTFFVSNGSIWGDWIPEPPDTLYEIT